MDLRNILILLAFGVFAVIVIVFSVDFSGETGQPVERVEEAELGIWSFKMTKGPLGKETCNASAQTGSKIVSIAAPHGEPWQIAFRATDDRFQTATEFSQLSVRIDDQPVLSETTSSEIRSHGRPVGVERTLELNSGSMDQFVEALRTGANLRILDAAGEQVADFSMEGTQKLVDYLNQCRAASD